MTLEQRRQEIEMFKSFLTQDETNLQSQHDE
jgi:hypothetical protein